MKYRFSAEVAGCVCSTLLAVSLFPSAYDREKASVRHEAIHQKSARASIPETPPAAENLGGCSIVSVPRSKVAHLLL